MEGILASTRNLRALRIAMMLGAPWWILLMAVFKLSTEGQPIFGETTWSTVLVTGVVGGPIMVLLFEKLLMPVTHKIIHATELGLLFAFPFIALRLVCSLPPVWVANAMADRVDVSARTVPIVEREIERREVLPPPREVVTPLRRDRGPIESFFDPLRSREPIRTWPATISPLGPGELVDLGDAYYVVDRITRQVGGDVDYECHRA